MKQIHIKMISCICALCILVSVSDTRVDAAYGDYNWPVTTSCSVFSGWYYSNNSLHGGVDFQVGLGTPVYAVAEGTVYHITDNGCKGSHNPGNSSVACSNTNCNALNSQPRATPNGGLGNWIMIDHGNNMYSICAHMQTGRFLVSEGDHVNQGQQIGYSGNAGNTTGPHVHFEMIQTNVKPSVNNSYGYNYRVKPMNFLTKQLVINNDPDYNPFEHANISYNISETPVSSNILPEGKTVFNKGSAVYFNCSLGGTNITNAKLYR